MVSKEGLLEHILSKERFTPHSIARELNIQLSEVQNVLLYLLEIKKIEMWFRIVCPNPDCNVTITGGEILADCPTEATCDSCGTSLFISDEHKEIYFVVKNSKKKVFFSLKTALALS